MDGEMSITVIDERQRVRKTRKLDESVDEWRSLTNQMGICYTFFVWITRGEEGYGPTFINLSPCVI